MLCPGTCMHMDVCEDMHALALAYYWHGLLSLVQ